MNTEVCFRKLYIHPDRKKSENMVKKVERLGYKAIMLTVDTTILGKRENDMRAKALSAVSMVHFSRPSQCLEIGTLVTGRRRISTWNCSSNGIILRREPWLGRAAMAPGMSSPLRFRSLIITPCCCLGRASLNCLLSSKVFNALKTLRSHMSTVLLRLFCRIMVYVSCILSSVRVSSFVANPGTTASLVKPIA